MINENFAERLFCDIRNNEIKIERAEYIIGGAKIGQFSDAKQLVIFGNERKLYRFDYGPAINFELSANFSFTDCYKLLLNEILKCRKIKCISLCVPTKGVIEAKLEEFDRIVSRYIKDYNNITDELYERWDILVQDCS